MARPWSGSATSQSDGETAFWEALEDYPAAYDNAATDPEDEALIFFTSDTTGDPQEPLQARRFVLGGLPCFLTAATNRRLDDEDLIWRPPS